MEKRDFELYEFGGLNDSKKITATFAHYEVFNGHEGLTISALLNEGELPRTNEGFRANGQILWVSLCQLYDKLLLASDEESCEVIINWCKNHVHPYYFYGDPYNVYDWHQKEDFQHWDLTVNLLGDFTFSLQKFAGDLYNLYRNTQIMIAFHNTIQKLELNKSMRQLVEGMSGYEGFFRMSEKEQLDLIKKYIDKHIPKFPMELSVGFGGEFQIVPAFQSVFDVAYYAMAQYVSASPDYPLHWGGRTGIAYCKSCGNIFIKNGNRQKYCDDPECKLERDRRKSKDYYYRKIQREKDEEWA